MTDKNLEQMRQDIDKIDSQITDLFRTRMETSLEIAKYKKEHQIPVLKFRKAVEEFLHLPEQRHHRGHEQLDIREDHKALTFPFHLK